MSLNGALARGAYVVTCASCGTRYQAGSAAEAAHSCIVEVIKLRAERDAALAEVEKTRTPVPCSAAFSPEDYTTRRAVEIVNMVFACSDHGHAVRVVTMLIDGGFVPRPVETPGMTGR